MTTDLVLVDGPPRLACAVTGEGPPVFFCHGVGGRRQNWDRQVAGVASEFTAIAWDARGYGDSDDYEGELRFSAFGDDIARALDHLDIERAHLVGLSMGARILMDFYPRHRDRVATLTLCDCFHGFETALSPDKQREYIELRERPLRSGKTFADLAPRLIDSLVSPTCDPSVRDHLHQSIVALRVESYLKTIRASVTFNRTDSLGSFDVPVQLIFGSQDRLTPPSIGTEMVELLPDAQLAVIDRAGHLSNLEAPDEFNRILLTFLAEHRTKARFRTEER